MTDERERLRDEITARLNASRQDCDAIEDQAHADWLAGRISALSEIRDLLRSSVGGPRSS